MNRHEALFDVERRKKVRVRVRRDLNITPQKYEGKTYYVVKDPVSLRYWRFKDKEQYLIELMDGSTTLDDAQKKFEQRFRPDRLTLEDLEHFAQQLLTAGLAHNDSAQVGKQLYESRKKRNRSEWMQILTNVLYIKIPVFDPDKVLARMLPYTRWIFTLTFLTVSAAIMLAAILLVATHFQAFRDKLPSYHEFFSFKNLTYMWFALGAVKIIHEFGHGLSCKAFGGETHEMGLLFLCLSPCLYCNVSDSWTLPDKWKRIIISSAGIYVELIIAALATFVWWNATSHPFVQNMALSLMVVCSVSTVVFNANPLMRYDGYYMLADWMEIPNLRDRSNKFLMRLVQEHCLGIELPPEQHMELGRRILFVSYAVVSYIYRWVVTFSILYFLSIFLEPYKLRALSNILAGAALGSMVGWPLYRLGKNLYKRGRLPDMKPQRVTISASVLTAVILFFFLVPLPVSRVREMALVQVPPSAAEHVHVQVPSSILKALHVDDGQTVPKDYVLAEFTNLEVENQLDETKTERDIKEAAYRAAEKMLIDQALDPAERSRITKQRDEARAERDQLTRKVEEFAKMKRDLVLLAPCDGKVMSPPRKDEVGRQWDKEKTQPFCSIGEPRHFWALLPVSTGDYRLLKEDRDQAQRKGKDLFVDVRVQGMGAKTWKGKIAQMPESEAKEVPLALTIKAGGPVAVKPSPNPNVYIPQNQQYLVGIDILNPDDSICAGTFAQVKVHCRWRTCAWWVWRTISSTFDLGLI